MKRLIGCTAALCLLAMLALMVGCGGVTNTGTLAYISNSTGTGFTVYNINTDGTLTRASISPQDTPGAPKIMQFSPNGKWAYFLDAGGANMYAYTRAGNGTLQTKIDVYPVGPNASSLVINSSSTYLYVAEPNTNMLGTYSIDPSTGILSHVGSDATIGYAITQLILSPSGTVMYGLSPTQQTIVSWTLNTSTGLAEETSVTSVGVYPNFMILSASGSYMYVTDSRSTYTIPGSGGLTTPNIFGFSTSSSGVLQTMGVFNEQASQLTGIYPSIPVGGATSHDNRYLFVVNQGSHNISVFQIATTSGNLLEVAGSVTTVNGVSTSTASPFDCGAGCSTPSYGIVAPSNNAIYVIDPNASSGSGLIFQYAIDQNTGRLRQMSPASVSGEGAPTWITVK
jgi:6-phosphogluconolactonase (cycloisomerase 2 family)